MMLTDDSVFNRDDITQEAIQSKLGAKHGTRSDLGSSATESLGMYYDELKEQRKEDTSEQQSASRQHGMELNRMATSQNQAIRRETSEVRKMMG